METLSKGRFGVIKRVIINKRIQYAYIARGTRQECLQYMIDLAHNSFKQGWCSDVQLSFHIVPCSQSAYFNITKFHKNQVEQLKIEYEIIKYQEHESE